MNRNGPIAPLVAVLAGVAPAPLLAVLAGVALALMLGACGSGSSGSHSAASPVCLPTTVDQSAKLAGLPVDVSPAPGTVTANPHTQISFLGVPAAEIHGVAYRRASSGAHAGRLEATRRATARASCPTPRSTPASA